MYEKYIPLSEPSWYILQSIDAFPKHGYAIAQDIKDMSNSEILISNGTLYGILKRMEVDKLIETNSEDKKKVYYITPLGKDILFKEYQRINRMVSNFQKINLKKGEKNEN